MNQEPGIFAYLRRLPAVHLVAAQPELRERSDAIGQARLVAAIQTALDHLRQQIQGVKSLEALKQIDITPQRVSRAALALLEAQERPRLQQVINATGVILHTNLGRAPLADEALIAIQRAASGYSNLELDLASGKRGERYDHVRDLLCHLTGAEAALVVNNNAAAVLLVLTALARDREVILSRGEMIEIGGSFRIPDVMLQSGARLVEVGTTNKTRISDYAGAITDQTALLLKVHPSNYRIIGFTESTAREDLVRLGQERGVPVVEDLGSGALLDGDGSGCFFGEPTVSQVVRSGIDVVTFSGDKLLGGPQGGIIAGKRCWIDRIAKHPLTRALRVDKLTLAALEATLHLYLRPEAAREQIPVLRALHRDEAEIREEAEMLAASLRSALEAAFAPDPATTPAATPVPTPTAVSFIAQAMVQPNGKAINRKGRMPAGDSLVRVEKSYAQVGGGALPELQIPSWAVVVSPRASARQLAEDLRCGEIPVLGRVQSEELWLDLRTVTAAQATVLPRLVSAVF
ncbi:L-seryl-tRNA(Sec) selenium transferase [Heliobacterium undosum]|uniref:L-seryl-tRNA(Sec) selenium transferase n=1 Tax=Heliomicrobium undosum TaxID=121734 RepID=A0A845KZR9_9FIRM|nr:L-seryl-tRNA(Sec) selenium transferase [Heliomicrobium undosum]MZP28726.1 L-seryl-tRNA(Sec) selenium transferase [Heliomicrobium undosum]